MANRNPPEHTRFKKGKCYNPGGRPKLPADLKAIAELTTDEMKRTIAKHFRLKKEELDKILDDPKSIALDLVIASTIKKAIDNGDISRAEYLFMRSLGRVKDVMEVIPPEPTIIVKSNGEQVELGTKKDNE